jgi:hypothetical protein
MTLTWLNQILKRQTFSFHYGSKVPAVTITVFIKRIFGVFLSLCMYYCWRFSYQGGLVDILITGLIILHYRACSKPEIEFLTSFCVFSELMGDAVVSFVDISGIVDHHYLNFPFIILCDNVSQCHFEQRFLPPIDLTTMT